MTTTKEKAEIMLAYHEGKTIQHRSHLLPEWTDHEGEPVWNWVSVEYRIKPEPREFWIHEYPSGELYIRKSEKESTLAKSGDPECKVIKVREVIGG